MADIKAMAHELVALTCNEVQKLQQQMRHDYGIHSYVPGCIGGHTCHDRLSMTKRQKQNRKARRKSQRDSRRKNR